MVMMIIMRAFFFNNDFSLTSRLNIFHDPTGAFSTLLIPALCFWRSSIGGRRVYIMVFFPFCSVESPWVGWPWVRISQLLRQLAPYTVPLLPGSRTCSSYGRSFWLKGGKIQSQPQHILQCLVYFPYICLHSYR